MKRENIPTDPTDIKKIIKKYHKQLYTYKFDNLDETDHSLKDIYLLEFTQEKIDNLTGIYLLIKSIINKHPKTESTRHICVHCEFY